MISLGNIEIAEVRQGAVLASGLFIGNVLLWPENTPVPTELLALKFTSSSNGSGFSISEVGSVGTLPSIEISRDDGRTWQSYTIGQSETIASGSSVYLRASGVNSSFSSSASNYLKLVTSGNVNLEGELVSLKDGSGENGNLAAYFFTKFLSDGTNSQNLTVDLDLSGITNVGQWALSGFADGVGFASGSKAGGFGNIQKIENGGFYRAFSVGPMVQDNLEMEDVDLTNLVSCGSDSMICAFTNSGVKKAELFSEDAVLSNGFGDEHNPLLSAFSGSAIRELVLNGKVMGLANSNVVHPFDRVASNAKSLSCVIVNAKEIGQYGMDRAFLGCTSIVSASFPNMKDIKAAQFAWHAFDGCTSLQRVDFPSLSSIDLPYAAASDAAFSGYAFKNCSSLTSINFPLLNSIEARAFKGVNWSGGSEWTIGMLANVANIKELHFGPDAYNDLTATRGWDILWDAPNPDQISVYCGNVMVRPANS